MCFLIRSTPVTKMMESKNMSMESSFQQTSTSSQEVHQQISSDDSKLSVPGRDDELSSSSLPNSIIQILDHLTVVSSIQ